MVVVAGTIRTIFASDGMPRQSRRNSMYTPGGRIPWFASIFRLTRPQVPDPVTGGAVVPIVTTDPVARR